MKAAATPNRQRPRPGRLTRIGPPTGAGRWSLVEPLRHPQPTPTQSAHAMALQLLERYGVVTREAVLAEGARRWVHLGVRRAQGARGARPGAPRRLRRRPRRAQFAVPGAVDRLRSSRRGARRRDPERRPRWCWQPPIRRSRTARRSRGPTARAVRRARRVRWSCCAPACRWRGSTAARGTWSRSRPAATDAGWAEALAVLVKDGRARSVEVRKIDGESVAPAGEPAGAARRRVHRGLPRLRRAWLSAISCPRAVDRWHGRLGAAHAPVARTRGWHPSRAPVAGTERWHPSLAPVAGTGLWHRDPARHRADLLTASRAASADQFCSSVRQNAWPAGSRSTTHRPSPGCS